jgi:hypothetical protein
VVSAVCCIFLVLGYCAYSNIVIKLNSRELNEKAQLTKGKNKTEELLTVDKMLYAKFGESLDPNKLLSLEHDPDYLNHIRSVIAKPSDTRPLFSRSAAEQNVCKLN